jgi:transcriptional regulator with XRE-family HTH domain
MVGCEDFKKALRERRETLDITQVDLAEMSGVSVRTIAAIEKGTGNPSIATVCKLLDVMGADLEMVIRKLT